MEFLATCSHLLRANRSVFFPFIMKINHTPFRERNRRRDNELVVVFKITITIDRYFSMKTWEQLCNEGGEKKRRRRGRKKGEIVAKHIFRRKVQRFVINIERNSTNHPYHDTSIDSTLSPERMSRSIIKFRRSEACV